MRCALFAVAACSQPPANVIADAPVAPPWQAPFGAHWAPDGSERRVPRSRRRARPASSSSSTPADRRRGAGVAMSAGGRRVDRDGAGRRRRRRCYGYRVWGPNWPYDPAWTPGSTAGLDRRRRRRRQPDEPEQAGVRSVREELSRSDVRRPARRRSLPPGSPIAPIPARTRRARSPTTSSTRCTCAASPNADAIACAGTYAGAATRADYLAGARRHRDRIPAGAGDRRTTATTSIRRATPATTTGATRRSPTSRPIAATRATARPAARPANSARWSRAFHARGHQGVRRRRLQPHRRGRRRLAALAARPRQRRLLRARRRPAPASSTRPASARLQRRQAARAPTS